MTTGLPESAPLSLLAQTRRSSPAGGRGTTLEERLEEAWRVGRAEGRAECPVCHSSMRFEGGDGRCAGCGSILS